MISRRYLHNISSRKSTRSNDKNSRKYFIESIPNEQVNPSHRQSTDFRNIDDIENKLTHFQIYHETEFSCKYRNPLYKTQYSEILVEYEEGFDMKFSKVKFDPYATGHYKNDGTPYVPVNFSKYNGQPGGNYNHLIVKVHLYKNYHL